MALSGRLKDFNLLQLLALVQKTGKSGALLLEHWGQTAAIYFEDGKLSKVHISSRSLASALLEAGKIDHERFELMSADLSEKAIALLLSDDGILTRQEVEEFIRQKMEEDLLPLLTWTDGTFKMELAATPSEGDIVTPLDLVPLLARARVHMAEWHKLVSAIPKLDVPLHLVAEPAAAPEEIRLAPDEWKLVVALAGEASLRQLAQRLEMDELAVRRITQRLVAGGLATLPAPPAAPAPTAPPVDLPAEEMREPEEPKQSKKGTFSRLVKRM